MNHKPLTLIIIALLTVSIFHSFVVSAFAAPPELRRVIIGFNATPAADLILRYGGKIKYQYQSIPAIACWLPPQAIDALSHNPQIAYIDDDVIVSLAKPSKKGYLVTRAFLDDVEINVPYSVNGVVKGITPDTLLLNPLVYSVSITYEDETQEQLATVLSGKTIIAEFYFVSPPSSQGTLAVTTTPVTGEVFVDGVSQGPAPISMVVDVGTYTVSFGGVAGYYTPVPQVVDVIENETTPVEGVYVPIPPLQGTLDITTVPVTGEVFIDGASEGFAPVVKVVAVGSYTISFGAVPGYVTPDTQVVTVYENQTTIVEGVYVLIPPPQGTLSITTTPVVGEVIIDGTSQGMAPVVVVVNVESYTISFGDVPDYITPDPQTVTVYENQTTFVEGVYEPEGQEPDPELPWGVDRIDAELAWSTGNGTNVQVAILDTGIDKDHPELQGNILAGINFVYSWLGPPLYNPNAWDDDHGHGTWCAGIVGALKNDVGVVGVAPNVDLVAVKVLDASGSGYMSDIIAGIEWCLNNYIDVISMSFAGPTYSNSLHNICNIAYTQGIVLIAAAGNVGDGNPLTNEVQYPAKYESVIAVAAVDQQDVVASFSADGAEVEVAAPGVSINSAWRGGGYMVGSGTSAACPHVAGTVALFMRLNIAQPLFAAYDTNTNGRWDSWEVRKRLHDTADDLGTVGVDVFYGYGLVDAQEAVTGVQTTP